MKRITLSLVIAALSGCQLWVDVDAPQCTSDKQCVGMLGRGYTCSAANVCEKPMAHADAGSEDDRPPLAPRWQCAREEPKGFVQDPNKKIKLRMDVVDVLMMKVPEGLHAMACTPGDVDCERPIASDVKPAGDGFMEFELPLGFEGFVKVEAPGYVPGLSYDNRPYTESVTTSGPAIIQPGALSVIASASGTMSDASLGLAFLEVRDCFDAAGEGVSFEPLGGNMPFYFNGALPARDLTMTSISNQLGANREPRAVGGFSDIKPGFTTFKAVVPETREVLSSVTVVIKSGYITYVRMRAGY
ncbi:MAG TPA: hypothetical protein VJV78_16955 [Polyangiales bacterium]|nr:hypothetical protein [Polyangiales bacterium]